MNKIVYIFGPSCSGKSTLALTLQSNLGSRWTYLDRDELIEKGLCSDLTADIALEKEVQHLRKRVIIDAQVPWREKRTGELYFLVLPPIDVLLKRDAQRTEKLKRDVGRAKYAKEYVIETHQILERLDKDYFDFCFDSSQSSVEEEVNVIKTYLV